jgi:hypothetical protein
MGVKKIPFKYDFYYLASSNPLSIKIAKMKKTILCTLLALASLFSFAQTWQPLGSGCGTNDQTDGVFAMTTYNGSLYAAGTFEQAGGGQAGNIARWDGSAWSPLGAGVADGGAFTYVAALCEYDGELYAGGAFQQAGGSAASNIARWDGTTWFPLGSGISRSGKVQAMASYKGYLYVAGEFDTAGGLPCGSIARWDGSSWSQVPNLLYLELNPAPQYINGISCYDGLYSLLPSTSGLYIGGSYPFAAEAADTTIPAFYPIFNLGLYVDTAFLPIADSGTFAGIAGYAPPINTKVTSLANFGGRLYASGEFDSAGVSAATDMAAYDGVRWNPISGFASGSSIYSPLMPYNGRLLMPTLIGSGAGVAAYDGTSMSNLGGALTGSSPSYRALCQWNGELYAGGQFSQGGGVDMQNIARLSPATGIQDLTQDICAIYPNPSDGLINVSGLGQLGEVEVTDIVGKVLLTSRTDGTGRASIDVSSLASGMYLVNGRKFIKQ